MKYARLTRADINWLLDCLADATAQVMSVSNPKIYVERFERIRERIDRLEHGIREERDHVAQYLGSMILDKIEDKINGD